MVPLKESWESGARKWTGADRTRHAKDVGLFVSLIAVTDNENQSKGDRAPLSGCHLPPQSGASTQASGRR